MIEEKYLVRKTATNKFYNVQEATEILKQYGLSHNEKKTRDLIAKNRLKARSKGIDPNDRRSGYEISEKSIYDLVVEEIPIMKDILEMIAQTKPSKPARRKSPQAQSQTKEKETEKTDS